MTGPTGRGKYENMTQDQFYAILEGIVDGMNASEILAISGAYEVFAEELNNDVLALWEEQNPDLVVDEDAPSVGDLVFDPRPGIALQSPYSRVIRFNNREGISTYNVDLESGDEDVSIEFYDSAWFLTEDWVDANLDDVEG